MKILIDSDRLVNVAYKWLVKSYPNLIPIKKDTGDIWYVDQSDHRKIHCIYESNGNLTVGMEVYNRLNDMFQLSYSLKLSVIYKWMSTEYNIKPNQIDFL
jgi:hypothetical protein